MLAGEWRPAWMGKPYSIDLRERVQAEVEGGQSRRAAARRYNVSASFAVKLVDLVSRTGSAQPARQGRPPGGGKLAPHLTALLEWVEAEPDITMPELAAKLKAEKDVTAHPASLSRVLLKAGLSFKKTLLASEAGREDVRQARDEWKVAPPAAHARGGSPAGLPRRNRHDDQDDPSAWPGSPRCPVEGRGAVRTLGDTDLHRRTAVRWPDRAVGGRPTHEPRDLRHLCRDPARPDAADGRRGDPRQPPQPQERKGRGCPQAARSLVPLPAALQPGPQSD